MIRRPSLAPKRAPGQFGFKTRRKPNVKRIVKLPNPSAKAQPAEEPGVSNEELLRMLRDVTYEHQLNDLMIQVVLSMRTKYKGSTDLERMAHCLATGLKAQLMVFYAVEHAYVTEEEVNFAMEVLEALSTAPEFGQVAVAGFEQMEEELQEWSNELDAGVETRAAAGTNIVDGVRVEGDSRGLEVGDTTGMNLATLGSNAMNYVGVRGVARTADFALSILPGVGGIWRDICKPIIDLLMFFHEVRNELGCAFDCPGQFLTRCKEIFAQDPWRYGFKFVSSIARMVIRVAVLNPSVSVVSSFVNQTANLSGNDGLSAWADAILRQFPSAENVWVHSAHASRHSDRGHVLANALYRNIGIDTTDPIAECAGKLLAAVTPRREWKTGFNTHSEDYQNLATWIREVTDPNSNSIPKGVGMLINIALFAIMVFWDLSAKPRKKFASQALNKRIHDKIVAELEKNRTPYPEAAQQWQRDQNEVYQANRQIIANLNRTLNDFNTQRLRRRAPYRLERLALVREGLSLLLMVSRRIGGAVEQNLDQQYADAIVYVQDAYNWYSADDWAPDAPNRPQRARAVADVVPDADDRDADDDLGLAPLRAQGAGGRGGRAAVAAADSEDEEEDEDEEDEDAPADRSGSIVDQVFAAHAMRRALEQAR